MLANPALNGQTSLRQKPHRTQAGCACKCCSPTGLIAARSSPLLVHALWRLHAILVVLTVDAAGTARPADAISNSKLRGRPAKAAEVPRY